MLVSDICLPVMFDYRANQRRARDSEPDGRGYGAWALKALGVERSIVLSHDGHSEYFGRDGYRVVSPAVHEVFAVAESGERETFLGHLGRHERGETTYLEMSRGLAQSGIEKWTVDTGRMTMTFYDKTGREMLVEQIK